MNVLAGFPEKIYDHTTDHLHEEAIRPSLLSCFLGGLTDH